MSIEPFHFKQFTIHQNKTAMKVGTDGVLLGAWVDLYQNPTSILDIGTGTGLIALQLAQRSFCETIDAVEIEPNAFEQAVGNFESSDWGDRLFCYHASLEEFANEIDDTYDLIVSNPPFFNNTYKKLEQNRALARHTESLNFPNLLQATAKLLSKTGNCAFIIPYQEEVNFLKLAVNNNLFPQKITRVKGNSHSNFKRTLLQLSFTQTQPRKDELIIEIERHIYTEAYKSLVEGFYLKI
ncbi:MAG: methyltransferase [Flavobacteriaceae bacterium]|nr:methyltransferase [Flavobacteriaceae bacterium]